MKHTFNGRAEKVASNIAESGHTHGVSLGRRAPMHRMHTECILEIEQSGLTPVLVIGSVNGARDVLYDPVHNPLTVEQQKEQFRYALPPAVFEKAVILTLDDRLTDDEWMRDFTGKLSAAGIHETSVMHFRAKAADADKNDKVVNKPLSNYAETFIANGLSVWHSYNARPADDDVSASDIRSYDLNHLTPEQKTTMAAPDYIVNLAQAARASNTARAALESFDLPLTLLDLTFDRLYKEAGIATESIIARAEKSGDVTVDSLRKAALDMVSERAKTLGPSNPPKPLLLLGPSVSPETADFLKNSGAFDVMKTTSGVFQSGEPFTEFSFDQQADFSAQAEKIKGSKAVVVQSTAAPVAQNVQHLLEMIHTLKFYGATEVTAVVPFAAFSRQDRPFDKRFTSVAADLLARQLKAAGADKVVSFTMHSEAAVQFYKNIFGDGMQAVAATDVFKDYLQKTFSADAASLVVGAPDGAEKPKDEGQRRARDLSQSLTGIFNEQAMFFVSKVHTGVNETKITAFRGDVAGKNCVVTDDMVDGGGTMLNTARFLKESGAVSVTCCLTHAILTDGKIPALEKLLTAKTADGRFAIDRLVMTDAIPEVAEKIKVFAAAHPDLCGKITVLPLGPTILRAVQNTPESGVAASPALKVCS